MVHTTLNATEVQLIDTLIFKRTMLLVNIDNY